MTTFTKKIIYATRDIRQCRLIDIPHLIFIFLYLMVTYRIMGPFDKGLGHTVINYIIDVKKSYNVKITKIERKVQSIMTS